MRDLGFDRVWRGFLFHHKLFKRDVSPFIGDGGESFPVPGGRLLWGHPLLPNLIPMKTLEAIKLGEKIS